jgi:hypothetical protein
MVYFVSPRFDPGSGAMGVEEFLGCLPDADRFDGQDRFMFIAEMMSRLTGELGYIDSYIRHLWETQKNYQIEDGYGDTSLILGGNDRYKLRLVKWTPLSMIALPNLHRVGLSYGFLHNHDFHLVTKGIFGDGYETEVYRYEASKIVGAIGEDVPLKFQGRFKLSQGAVMWYEQYHDVHNQIPPSSFSLSFNVIPVDAEVKYPQLSFSMPEGKVDAFTKNRQARVLSLLTLLCDFSRSDETLDVLIDAARTSNNAWLNRGIAALIAERWHKDWTEALDLVNEPLERAQVSKFSSADFSIRHVA